MNKEEIIKEYLRSQARKSHISTQAKYGKDFYSIIAKKRWDKKRLDGAGELSPKDN
jgi:hypothetical protein